MNEIKSFKLMGQTIRVCENHEREFKSQNKHTKCPSKVIEAIKSAGGTNLIFLMEKKLQDTDLNKYQNRIYVPKNKLIGYLTEDEKQKVETQGIGGGLDVVVIDPKAAKYRMKLKMWASCNKYALIKEWGRPVRDNGLLKDDTVEIWGFRVDSKLRLFVYCGTTNVDLDLRVSS